MKKLFIIIAIIIGTLSISVLITTQVWITLYVKIKFSSARTPELYQVPSTRNIIKPEVNLSEYPTYSYYKVSFQTPWKKRIEEKEEKDRYITLTFAENKSITLLNNQIMPGMTKALLEGNPKETQKIKDFFGKEHMLSDYHFIQLILNTTPSEIGILNSRKQAITTMVLLNLKSIILPRFHGDIYTFATPAVTGFQFQTDKPNIVLIQFFDENQSFDMIVSGTQTEIDFILSSIKISS